MIEYTSRLLKGKEKKTTLNIEEKTKIKGDETVGVIRKNIW